ncbi:translation initiation factor 2, partial [Lacticaseibacillus paracasei subsp. paracasei CNCM I-4648]
AKKPVAASAKSNDHADAAEHSQKTQNLLLSKKTSRRGQIRPLTAKSS